MTDDEYLDKTLLEVKRLWPPFLGGRRIAKKVKGRGRGDIIGQINAKHVSDIIQLNLYNLLWKTTRL